jgi:CBS domain-containing protein
MDTPLVVALELFLSYRVSSLPVVDSSGQLISFYAKADVVVSSFGHACGSYLHNLRIRVFKTSFRT